MSSRRYHPIRRALTGPVLVVGCELVPLIIGEMVPFAFMGATGFRDFRINAMSIGLMIFDLWLVRLLAKYDPRFMSKLYEHFAWQQESYPPHTPLPIHLEEPPAIARATASLAMFVSRLRRLAPLVSRTLKRLTG